jgi:hypothetical protein
MHRTTTHPVLLQYATLQSNSCPCTIPQHTQYFWSFTVHFVDIWVLFPTIAHKICKILKLLCCIKIYYSYMFRSILDHHQGVLFNPCKGDIYWPSWYILSCVVCGSVDCVRQHTINGATHNTRQDISRWPVNVTFNKDWKELPDDGQVLTETCRSDIF